MKRLLIDIILLTDSNMPSNLMIPHFLRSRTFFVIFTAFYNVPLSHVDIAVLRCTAQ